MKQLGIILSAYLLVSVYAAGLFSYDFYCFTRSRGERLDYVEAVLSVATVSLIWPMSIPLLADSKSCHVIAAKEVTR